MHIQFQPWPSYSINTSQLQWFFGVAEFMTNAEQGLSLCCLNLQNPASRLRAAQEDQTQQLAAVVTAENGLTGAA